MGISGMHEFLRNAKVYSNKDRIPFDAYVRKEQPTTVWVDVLAVFYEEIKTALMSHHHAVSFAKYLEALFSNAVASSVDVHFLIDGKRSQEKRKAHEERDSDFHSQLDKLEAIINKCKVSDTDAQDSQTESHAGLQTELHGDIQVDSESLTFDASRASTGTQWQSPSRSQMLKMEKLLKSAKILSFQDKQNLYETLRDFFHEIRPGYYIHLCEGEADVHVAHLQAQKAIVISKDSDFFCHLSVACTLIPYVRDDELLVTPVKKEAILEKLDIANEEHLAFLGVVSGNDYSSKIPYRGVKKNYNWYLSRQSVNVVLSGEELLRAFERDSVAWTADLDENHFSVAYRVFLSWKRMSRALLRSKNKTRSLGCLKEKQTWNYTLKN